MEKITVHAINLPKRKDRRKHIVNQFIDKKEFNLKLETPVPDKNGARSLWRTIKSIIRTNLEDDFIVVCEDDHEFTKHYSPDRLYLAIQAAIEMNADFLSGGVSWIERFFFAGNQLYWIDGFNGTQFIIIFKRLYTKILRAGFGNKPADDNIGDLAKNKFVIFPFISIQKDFGYSDATIFNNEQGRVEKLFFESAKSFEVLNRIDRYYLKNKHEYEISISNITIPTYIINLTERKDRLVHITRQFKNKPEFDITIISAIKDKIGALGLWRSIRKVIKIALSNQDDVILIVEDDHQFTKDYSKEYFLRNVIESHQQNADYLIGGTSGFKYALPISRNRYWIHPCLSTQFIVVYKKFFKKILDEAFDESVIADLKLSEMTSNKMIVFPFISTQKDFGYSDVTQVHNQNPNLVSAMFRKAKHKLQRLQEAANLYKKSP